MDNVIEEYVKTAQAILQEDGAPYTTDTLQKLSMVLIEQDRQAALQKEAEYVVYKSFANELAANGIDPIPVLRDLAKMEE